VSNFKDIEIKATIEDACYNTKDFFDSVSTTSGQSQIISQIKSTQLINVGDQFKQVG
jgi:hypothetical protein